MVKWIPNTDYQIASASYDDTIKIWDNEDDDYHCIQTISDHTSTVWSIVASNDGRHLYSSSEDHTIKVYTKSSNDQWVFSLNISGYHERAIYSIDFSLEYRLLASVGDTNKGRRR